MSGILGIWHLDGRDVDRRDLGRLRATLSHRGADHTGLCVDGAAGLACCLGRLAPESARETQPVVDEGAMLVFDGRLDNREELLAGLQGARVSSRAPDSALALAAYREFGDEFPIRLSGDFAVAVFDARRSQLLLARDAIGIRPLYYYVDPDLFLFASEIKTLLAHRGVRSRPDDEILADFIFTQLTGRHPQERTFFRNIARVLPAHVVVVTPVAVRARRYWDFDLTRQVRFARFAEYAEAFKAHLERAVRRRLRSASPVAVSVSGGLDSSAVFCLAETLRRREPHSHPALIGVSQMFPDGSPSDEKQFLGEIERAYGVTIERFPNPRGGIMADCDAAIRHVEAPLLDAQGNGTHAFLETTRQLGARVLLTGHWGDQFLFDDTYLVDLYRRGAWWQAWKHLNEFSRWVDVEPREFRLRLCATLVKHCAPDALVSTLRSLRKRFRPATALRPWYTDAFRALAAVERVGHDADPPAASAHARALYREARSPYHALCMEWNDKTAAMHGLEIAFPFLDRDLIAFLMAIPGEMQSWNGVHKGILREGLRGVLPERIGARVAKADFTRAVNDGLAMDYNPLVERLRVGGMVTSWGYVHAQGLERLLAGRREIRGSTCEPSWALGDLLALEVWLQTFFGRPESPGDMEMS